MVRLYTPPAGTYDQPFAWVFDATALPNGPNALNQFVYMQGPLGDFVLRRMVGFNTVVLGGKFQVKDPQGNYLEAEPVISAAANDDYAVAPEVNFKQTSRIGLDLYAVNKTSPAGLIGSQIVFQGVRRQLGTLPQLCQPGCVRKKSFTYVVTGVISNATDPNAPLRLVQVVDDYDFEFHQLILTYCSSTAPIPPVVGAGILFDPVRQQLSNRPMLDIFMNGSPGSPYQNGAIVPPLCFPQESRLELDIYSLIQGNPCLPVTVKAYFVGKKRFPC